MTLILIFHLKSHLFEQIRDAEVCTLRWEESLG